MYVCMYIYIYIYFFSPEPTETAKDRPQYMSEGGRIWQEIWGAGGNLRRTFGAPPV